MTIPKPNERPWTSLYRMFDEDDALLYVGITHRHVERFTEHSITKPWWHLVRRIDVEHFSTRAEAIRAESEAIYEENPRFNQQGIGWREEIEIEKAKKSGKGICARCKRARKHISADSKLCFPCEVELHERLLESVGDPC